MWTVAWALAVIALTLLVVAPLTTILLTSLTGPDGVTFDNFVEAYGTSRRWRIVGNTLALGTAVAVLAVAMGLPLAWLVTRTNVFGKRYIRFCSMLAFIAPPYLIAVGWILLAGPNAGHLNVLWQWLTGENQSVLNVFSFGGLAWVTASSLFYFVFVFTAASLENVSSDVEEAAAILGATRWQTATSITLPLVAPAIMGSLIVVFLQSIALYGVPALLSFPARYPVVVTTLLEFFEYPVNVGGAAAYVLPLVAVTVALQYLQRRYQRRRGFVTLGGKGSRRQASIPLGRARVALSLLATGAVSIITVMPLAVLFQAAISRAWGNGLTQSNFTADRLVALVEHPAMRGALLNSLYFAISSAGLATLVAVVTAYLVVKKKSLPYQVLGFIAMAPYVIPGIVLAIGYYAAFAAPPLSLYGTSLILILAFAARFLPISYTGVAASLTSYNQELEDAATILGARRLRVVASIVMPMIKKSIIGSALLIFILASHELSVAVFLAGPTTKVVSLAMLEFADNGQMEQLAAMGLALIAITFCITLLGQKLAGRDFMIGSAK